MHFVSVKRFASFFALMLAIGPETTKHGIHLGHTSNPRYATNPWTLFEITPPFNSRGDDRAFPVVFKSHPMDTYPPLPWDLWECPVRHSLVILTVCGDFGR